jgi:RNA recognition motif-containing protein
VNRTYSNDVNGGFRNLSFDTSNESLKEALSRFGDVSLAIVCKFPGTDQPTGNAFVHFKDRESADKCLEELEVGFALKFLNIHFVCLDFRPFH